MAHFIKNLLTREEMEYDVPGDEEKYVARPINRFRSAWYDAHLLHSFWRVTETTNSVYTFMKTPGAFGAARACADLTPEMIEGVQLRAQQTGGKATLHGILKDKDTPNEVRKAFATLGHATASLVGSDGHRRELRGEGEAYTLRFGPPSLFVTPNLADTKQPLILTVQGVEHTFDTDLTEAEHVTFSDMSQRIAADPGDQAVAFELLMRLFFVHVLGLRPETVGWRRGEVRKASEHWVSDGVAADLMGVPTVFGPLAAAFGPVEAQGRGSLHPHILIWLLQAQLRVLLDMLQRDQARFQERLNLWQRQLVQAVVATQQSAVELLPLQLQGGENRCGVQVPPLPFGPNEKRYSRADGGAEMATAEQLGVEGEMEPKELWFYDPQKDDYHKACRPDLPLRNDAGEAVDDEATWAEQKAAESKGYWRRPLSSSACGVFPRYRGVAPWRRPSRRKASTSGYASIAVTRVSSSSVAASTFAARPATSTTRTRSGPRRSAATTSTTWSPTARGPRAPRSPRRSGSARAGRRCAAASAYSARPTTAWPGASSPSSSTPGRPPPSTRRSLRRGAT